MSAILNINNLVVSYGPITAIKGINLSIEEGSITALLGANGAGKTTLLKTISGITKESGGTIVFDGKEIGKKHAFKIAKQGILQSPEGRMVFKELSIEDNLKVGAYTIKGKAKLKENLEKVYALFPILEQRKKQQANTLSGGEQQMLAIGRALMGDPKLLLLDEPSLGLAPLIIKDIFETLVKIKASGVSILIVEQNAQQTLKIADYAYVLELGKISIEGKGEELLKDNRLIEAYLGGKK